MKTKLKLYVILYNKQGRKKTDLKLKESICLYFVDGDCEPYEHNLKVKAKGFPNGRWVTPYAVFGELREAKEYIKKIMFDDKSEDFYIKKVEFEVTGF